MPVVSKSRKADYAVVAREQDDAAVAPDTCGCDLLGEAGAHPRDLLVAAPSGIWHFGRNRRTVVALSIGITAALMLIGVAFTSRACPANRPGSALLGLEAKMPVAQQGALNEWLYAADEAAADVAAPADERARRAAADEAFEAIQKAMEGRSPDEARALVKKAIDRSAERSLSVFNARHPGLADPPTVLEKVHDHVQKKADRLKAEVTRFKQWRQEFVDTNFPAPTAPPVPTIAPPKTDAQKARTASCVFGVLLAANSIAQGAINIVSSKATCAPPPPGRVIPAVLKRIRRRLCRINITVLLRNYLSMAGSLATAASSCAASTNVRAVCAGLVFRFATFGMGLTSSILLARSACKDVNRYPPDRYKASTIGDIPPLPKKQDGGRRLFLGGGLQNMETACGLDVTRGEIFMAGAALAVNRAAQVAWRDPGSCQGLDATSLQEIKDDLIDRPNPTAESICAFDVTAVLLGLFAAIGNFMLTDIHCINRLNLPVLCAAAMDGLLTSLASISNIATGFYIFKCRNLDALTIPDYPGLPTTTTTDTGPTTTVTITTTTTTTTTKSGHHWPFRPWRHLQESDADDGTEAAEAPTSGQQEGEEVEEEVENPSGHDWSADVAELAEQRNRTLHVLRKLPRLHSIVDPWEDTSLPWERDDVDLNSLESAVRLMAPVLAEDAQQSAETPAGGASQESGRGGWRWPNFSGRCE